MNLFKFDLIRLKNNKILFFLPTIILVICIVSSLVLQAGFLELPDNSTPTMNFSQCYSFIIQFTYIATSIIYVYVFSNDFNGVYPFMKTIGFSLEKYLIVKAIILYIISAISIDISLFLTSIICSNTDLSFLGLTILAANSTLLYIISLCILLSVLIKKTLPAFLTAFGLFIILSLLNPMAYGLISQVNPSSITLYVFDSVLGIVKPDKSLYKLLHDSIDVSSYKWLLTSIPNIIWTIIILIFTFLIITKLKKKIYKI